MEESRSTRNNMHFYVYRYQLLAQIDPTQPNLVFSTPDRSYSTVDELRADKNNIFSKMLRQISFHWSRGEISHQIIYSTDEIFLIQLAVNRPTVLRTPDFRSLLANDWPWIYIYIDNNPDHQYLVIEGDRDAWASPDITVGMLERNFNKYLSEYCFTVGIEPLIEKTAFWEFVEKNKGLINVVEFDMISPNMSNISSKSTWPLQQIRDEYNATRQIVRLENGGTAVNIKKDDLISSLAEYSSLGGGKTRFLIRGIRGYKSLSDNKIDFEIESIDLQSDDPEVFYSLADHIRDLLRKL